MNVMSRSDNKWLVNDYIKRLEFAFIFLKTFLFHGVAGHQCPF